MIHSSSVPPIGSRRRVRAPATIAVAALIFRAVPSASIAALLAPATARAHEGPVPRAADDPGAAPGPILGPGNQWTPSTPAGYESVSEVVRPAVPESLAPQLGGRWSDVYGWPVVAVHAALLPNGKVIAWDATPDDADEDPHTTDNYTTRTTLWDPATNVHVQTYNDTDTDLFCAGVAGRGPDPDGTGSDALAVAGGSGAGEVGIVRTGGGALGGGSFVLLLACTLVRRRRDGRGRAAPAPPTVHTSGVAVAGACGGIYSSARCPSILRQRLPSPSASR